jgi:hypothetical protein
MIALTLWQFLAHDLFHPLTGPGNAHQGGYLFWSGIAGSFLIGGGIWGTLLHNYRRHNCHARWCPRIGKHPVNGTPYSVCRKHHPRVPDGGASAEHIAEAHKTGMIVARADIEPMGETTTTAKDGW